MSLWRVFLPRRRRPDPRLTLRPARGWTWRMAWRDTRGRRRQLLLVFACIVLGVAGLVAVRGLRDNLADAVRDEARSLLGADLELRARRAFTPEVLAWGAQLGGQQSEEVRLRTLARFERVGQSRLVQVRALGGEFPFYGARVTDPAAPAWRGDAPGVLVERGLMDALGLRVGDTVRLGRLDVPIAAALVEVSGEAELAGVFAPRVYLDLQHLPATGLLQTGSVAQYRRWWRFDAGLDAARAASLAQARSGLLAEAGVESTTVAERREALGAILDNLFGFLGLVGMVSLVLGAVGVAGAVRGLLREKLASIAVLRCLGVPAGLSLRIYLAQSVLLGLAGALVGVALGLGAQLLIPRLLAGTLPFTFVSTPSLGAILGGLGAGVGAAVLASLPVLLPLRRVSPLRVWRSPDEGVGAGRDPWVWAAWGLALAALVGLAASQAARPLHGVIFAAALVGAFLVLLLVARLLQAVARRLVRPRAPYALRLALSSLYRPRNRTAALLAVIGLGVFLVHTLMVARDTLLAQARVSDQADAPDVVLLDVQPDQLDAVRAATLGTGAAWRDALPIVTMRVTALGGRTLREIKADPRSGVMDWVTTWEFRTTWREALLDNETIAAGAFPVRWDGAGPIPISVAENYLKDMNLGLGDRITWDVQGVPLETVVASIRRVDWRIGRQNFGIVFPPEALAEAPVTYAGTARADARPRIAALQQTLATVAPNVSLLDLSLLYETLRQVLDKVSLALRLLAAATLVTGWIVLAGAVLGGRAQREREGILLRTLGAPGRLVQRVADLEHLILGLLGGLAGSALAVAAGAALAAWVFKAPLVVDPLPTALAVLTPALLAALAGRLLNGNLVRKPPLAALREGG